MPIQFHHQPKPETTYSNELWENSGMPKPWLLQYTHTYEITLEELEDNKLKGIMMTGFTKLMPESGPDIKCRVSLTNDGIRECFLHLIMAHKN
jgi:hypothetical protein